MSANILGIHHVGIVVEDMPRAVAFYRNVIGLEEIPTPSTFEFPEGRTRVRWFLLGPRLHLHLQPGPAETSIRRHTAIEVKDAEQMRATLREHGVAIDETMPIPGADRFYCKDPDGNLLEFIEWREDWPSADPAPVWVEKDQDRRA